MVVLTDTELDEMLPATFYRPGLTEEEYFDLCAKFDNYFVEYSADGTVIVTAGTDPASGCRTARVGLQLGNWAESRGGMVTGPDASFLFPNGARREPDAAWSDEARWEAAKAREAGKRVPVFAPDFVIEIRTPEQHARMQREKMDEYMENGVLLAWLIDLVERTVTIYRPGREPEALINPAEVAGEGPVAGFVLKLDCVFT
jgi:Uma2 family endonuclease